MARDQSRAAVKESVMDFAGHFSTASAILAGFYMATCAFIINIRATGTDVFKFLDEPLLAEIAFLGDLIKDILLILNLSDWWPTHFEYMLFIFISLFLLSLVSYACFLRVGMIQMTMYKSKRDTEEEVLIWLERGMYSLLISLIFCFLTLPWALLRFISEQALILAILLLAVVIVSLTVAVKLWNVMKRTI
ncbi:MAG: hypothetical protein JSV04_08830 [Candidatus Heimdallarchaeota archaeon]|nr:MAG: hypothetical protein JSV04_08830 [Candidatus Heimdallarchaeota archaeon]